MLKKLGIKQKPKPTDIQRAREEREEKEKQAWRYVRSKLDLAVRKYLETGGQNTTDLESLLSNELYQQTIDELQTHLAAGVKWGWRERYGPNDQANSGKVNIEIVDETLTGDGQLSEFTVREYFDDNSRVALMSNNVVVNHAGGVRKGIMAKVRFLGESRFEIVSSNQLPGV